jgi:hypothetical protein
MDAVTTPTGHRASPDATGGDQRPAPPVTGADAARVDSLHGTPAPPPPSGPVLPSRASKVTAVVAAAALGGACLYTAMVDPNSSGAYPQCPLRLVTGVDCALCGGMRATHAMLGGDIMRAANQNLMVVVLAPFALWATAQWFGAQWGVRLPSLPTRKWMAPALLVAAIVFSVVRNLGVGPGPWLHSDTF